MKESIGTSHGKIILIGEHAVVYGQPAIALPVSMVQMRATITETDAGQTLDTIYYSGPLAQAYGQMAGIRSLIEHILNDFAETEASFSMKITSDIPAERGMGSSAATAIAVIRALFNYFNHPLTHKHLLKLATISEKVIHGNPSGLDAATAAATAPVLFRRGQPLQTLPISLHAYLVIADSGIKGQTGAAVSSVHDRLETDYNGTMQSIKNIGALTLKVVDDISNDHVEELGTHLLGAQENLWALGVSNRQLDHLIQVANENGSLGTKLTGGGRGGCLIGVVSDLPAAQHLAHVLQDAGAAKTWIQPLHEETQAFSHFTK
ncbi:mevalonate kinase [Lactobacillus selangorensis]|uniref:Mevalonate kinase n=1 Tax=Lactobacillus selangorensis TaxID=81857 RepID=A0A0R2GAY8_9LACO|nr:mevalonate kinase [Lactobacillus selangorensis]KRN29498.1 mevalonate kinase [Lactobacillus selangorensis]KRN33972.1 mevalonate kinase [Lactobacillus selangorensis]